MMTCKLFFQFLISFSYFSKPNEDQDHQILPFYYSKKKFEASLKKSIDCQFNKPNDDIVSEFLKCSKSNKKKKITNEYKRSLTEEDDFNNHVNQKIVNFQEFQQKRSKYKKILVINYFFFI